MIAHDVQVIVPGGTRDESWGARDQALERADEVIRLVRDLASCTAIVLTAWDPTAGTHRHRALASDGYSDELLDHMNDGYVKDNPAFRLLHTKVPHALRWRDIARDWNLQFASTRIAEDFLIPAGFREGTTACLWNARGRYTGSLHASWNSPAAATDERREVIESFRPLLADVCDLLRVPAILAAALAPNAFALFVSSKRLAAELSGRPTGPHLKEGGELRRFLSTHWTVLKNRRFLWIDELGSWHRVELIACSEGATLVAEQPVAPPYGLTRRELDVLHLLSTGASNPQIADRLVVGTRTVSTHVEHILAKLDCESRSQLAAKAVAEGLLLAEASRS
jgi:DNA-binding CsgD family transcriptional regulator